MQGQAQLSTPDTPTDPAELAQPVQPSPDRRRSIYSVVTVMPRQEIPAPPLNEEDEWCDESTKPRGQLVNVAAELARSTLPSMDPREPASTQFLVFTRGEMSPPSPGTERNEVPSTSPAAPRTPLEAAPGRVSLSRTRIKPGLRIPLVTIIAFAAAALAWAVLLLLTLS